MRKNDQYPVLPAVSVDEESASKRSSSPPEHLLSPGHPSSSSVPEHQGQPDSPGFTSPNTRARRTLQAERGERNPYEDRERHVFTVEGHLEEYFKPRALLGVTVALACANGADAVEILAAGLFMSSFRDANGAPLTTSGKELLSSSIFVGMLIGGLFGGWMSDRFGRKPTLVATLTINAIGGLLSAVPPSVGLLIVFRVLSGFGVGASIPSIFSLGAELFPTASRGTHLSYVASAWCLGSLYEAGMAWIILGVDLHGRRIYSGATWRAFVVATALPVVVTTIVTILFVPRSPRWLLNQGRYEEASVVLYQLTDVRVPPLTLRTSYPKQQQSETAVARLWWQLRCLMSKHQRGTSLRLMVLWACACYSSYGVGSWMITILQHMQVDNEFAARFLFALANVPGNVASLLLIESLGRRRLLWGSMLLAAFFAFVFAACASPEQPRLVPRQDWACLLVACVFNAFSSAGWNALDTLSSESFPLQIRTTSLGILSAVGRMSSILAQFVNGHMEREQGPSAISPMFAVTGVVLLIGTVCAISLPHEPAGVALDRVGSEDLTASNEHEAGRARKGSIGSGRPVKQAEILAASVA